MAMFLERRAFLTLLGCALASRPITVSAAQPTRPRTVGVLIGIANDAETKTRIKAFEGGLARDGWSVGNDLRIEYRFSEGNFQLMQVFADEFARLKPDCILGHSTPVVEALMKATRTIPIVFVAVTDPIGSKFVASIARPGGNATGFTLLQPTMAGKYLLLLREFVPQLAEVALIYNPDSVPNAGAFFMQPFIDTAREFRIKPIGIRVHNSTDIESGIAHFARKPDIGFMVVPDNFITLHRELLITLAAQYRIPAIYPYRYFVESGGLLSYGVDAADLFTRASDYVSRILRGTNPADLPVQAPTKFELVINLRTAANLGLKVPKVLLAGADYLIN